jgi:HEAT repeat protein
MQTLSDSLRDDDESVRCWAAVALGDMGPAAKDVVPGLVVALRTNGDRQQILGALKKIGPAAKQAVPVLIELLQDTQPYANRMGA